MLHNLKNTYSLNKTYICCEHDVKNNKKDGKFKYNQDKAKKLSCYNLKHYLIKRQVDRAKNGAKMATRDLPRDLSAWPKRKKKIRKFRKQK